MEPKSIHHFRTHKYRVFLAESYFKLDLEEEISWHESHLRKLKVLMKNPSLFHKEHTSHPIDEHRERHFQEHVVDSIPFHEKIYADHQKRLKTILEIMPEKTYKKLHALSLELDTVPEYLIFDRTDGKFFFAVEKRTSEKEKWAKKAKSKGLSDVVFLA